MRPLLIYLLAAGLLAGCQAASTDCGGGSDGDDPDNDGLPSAVERRLGTDPDDADTDDDGLPDGAEVGDPSAPRDTDGDGRIDALESARADRDGDCLPDQLDADDASPASPDVLRDALCRREGVCGAGAIEVTAACDAGLLRCTYVGPEFEAVETRCDGLDNDCDGLTDEGIAWRGHPLGSACDAGGACGVGLVVCGQDGAARCSSADAATEEVCNGVDDDCDGEMDEGLQLGADGPLLGEPCAGTGVCPPGVVECLDGGLRCSTHRGGSDNLAADELCNGLDDDCDGETDEGFAADGPSGALALGAPCGTGRCAGGRVECAPGGMSARCSTAPLALHGELCNAEDDDCDGETDERVDLDLGESGCPVEGVCANPEVLLPVCVAGEWSCETSSAGVYQLVEETACDGLDNDCDGLTDEPFTLPTSAGTSLPLGAPCGLGACAGGVVTCTGERCNGQDDACDGVVDDGVTWSGLALGTACGGVGVCPVGSVVCSAADEVAVCSTLPGGLESLAGVERCNGLDDDCDGATDEAEEVQPDAESCVAPGVCGSGTGTPVQCVDGGWVCDFATVTGFEPDELTCDGLDNDCDTAVDEFLPKVPGPGWSRTAAGTPPPRAEMIAALAPPPLADSGWIVVVGGDATIPGPFGASPPPLTDTWRYNPSTTTWDQLREDGVPARIGASLVSDPAGHQLVRFGGASADGTVHGDVWVADGQTWAWSQLSVLGAAVPRARHAAVLDPSTRWMWVIGGLSEGAGAAVAALDLQTQKWITSLPDGPGWRAGVAAAYEPSVDGGAGRIVVFGGRSPSGELLGDTWVLDLDELGWIPVPAAIGPPPREDHRMATVPGGGVMLYGGAGATSDGLADLWRFDSKTLTWVPVLTGLSPPGRRNAAFVSTGDGAVLVGGRSDGEAREDAWKLTLDPPVWTEIGTGTFPPPRADPYVAWLGVDGKVLLFGGVRRGLVEEEPLGDLWRLDVAAGSTWSHVDGEGPRHARFAAAIEPGGVRLWVHGGLGPDGEPSPELWTLAGEEWTVSTPTTSEGSAVGLAAHAAAWVEGQLWLHGGLAGGAGALAPVADLWRVAPDGGLQGLTAGGAVPSPVYGHVLLAAGDEGLILVGGVGTGGAVLRLQTKTLQWEPIAVLPETAVERPTALLEPARGLVVIGVSGVAGPRFWTVGLASHATESLPASTAPPALEHAAAVFDPIRGRGFLFGGLDSLGRTRNALWSLGFTCAPAL